MPQQSSVNALVDAMTSPVAERVSVIIATGAITAPAWRDYVHSWAVKATDIASCLGVIYLAMQIVLKALEFRRGAWRKRGG